MQTSWSGSGRMAYPAPNTGYELKLSNLFSYMDTAHTPSHFSDSHHDFQNQDDATVISTIDPVCRTQKHLAVAKQQQAEFLQCSDFQASGNRWQIMCRVDQASRKLESNFGQRSVVTTIFSSQSKGKRDRDTNVLLSLKERISRKTLNGKLTRPFEER